MICCLCDQVRTRACARAHTHVQTYTYTHIPKFWMQAVPCLLGPSLSLHFFGPRVCPYVVSVCRRTFVGDADGKTATTSPNYLNQTSPPDIFFSPTLFHFPLPFLSHTLIIHSVLCVITPAQMPEAAQHQQHQQYKKHQEHECHNWHELGHAGVGMAPHLHTP